MTHSASPALTDQKTLEAAVDSLTTCLPLNMQGAYTPEDFYNILLRAASRADTIEHTAQTLEGAPNSNTIRYHLNNQFTDMALLESQVNAALKVKIPSKVRRCSQVFAIDLHLIPYYGNSTEATELYINRSQAKAGTTSFFAYATIYTICRDKRVTLGIHAVRRDETLVATVTYLLAQLSELRIRVKRLCLDRGFYNVPVIRWLKALNIAFIMPAIVRGKKGGTRALLTGRKSYRTPYVLNSSHYGTVQCQMNVVCSYLKGKTGKHGIRHILYVTHRIKVCLRQLHKYYRQRFGIETSYRMKNTCRIRTTTKNPVLRFLFVALAFVLVNLWVYLLWHFISRPMRGGKRVYRELFPLKTMLEFISHAVEQRFPVITAIYLTSPG